MPLYEYACDSCQQQFEVLVRGHERPACPECGSLKLEKLLSVPAAHTGKGLPVCDIPYPAAGNCGKPQCGTGGCQMGGF